MLSLRRRCSTYAVRRCVCVCVEERQVVKVRGKLYVRQGRRGKERRCRAGRGLSRTLLHSGERAVIVRV